MRRALLGASAGTFAGLALIPHVSDEALAAATPTAGQLSDDDAFLSNFVGTWEMYGEVRGKSVRYRAEASRVLGGAWIELHMIDEATPPSYEATLFMAADDRAHDYVGHWLDQFGGAGARVAATGSRTDRTLTMIFPYADGAFRNIWLFDPDTRQLSLTIESQEHSGNWTRFARYDLRRRS